MEQKIYPQLEGMCRLCLKENAGTVCIFPKEKISDKYASLSIPMRIMACAALEVQDSDDLPKKICTVCRLQLEKSYYFRKQSQISDAKLKKHLRLIGMGKTSKVFLKLDEDDDDELEFQDTLDFIKEQEDILKQDEKLKLDIFLNEIKLQNEQDLKKIKEMLRVKCREELIPEIREQLRNELRLEVERELEESLRKEISEQCLSETKENLRDEVREECRQLEIKCLLDDLQCYLVNKKNTLESATSDKGNLVVLNQSNNCPTNNKDPIPEVISIVENSSKMEVVQIDLDSHNQNVQKENNLKEVITEDYINVNDEECDSEGNFLIYDTDDGGFDVQQKSFEDKVECTNNIVTSAEYEDDEMVDSNNTAYEKVNEENIDANEESVKPTTRTTSYHIKDNENGEIQFLKKSNESINDEIDEENPDQANEDIMVINFPEGSETECEGQYEEIKYVKAKQLSMSKSKKTKMSTITRTTSTSETFLAKTYVNPMQRSTDTPKIFKCNECPIVFSTKPSLERHSRTHRKLAKSGANYQCPECCIVVSCSSALRRHMYVHCEEKPFSCNICKKSFVQKEILKRHMQTHTGIKPHQCPHCERSFAQRINLTQHINRTHLEEPRIQQHPCHLCPKRFNHASGLSRHLASHSGVAFQCSECDRTFGDRSSIKRHIVNMHGSDGKASKGNEKSKSP